MVEALLCVVLLGVLAVIAGAAWSPMASAGHLRSDLEVLNLARGKMEELRSGPAMSLAGEDTLVVRGEEIVRRWSSDGFDVDGDGRSEADAFRLRVDMGEVSLETIRTEPGDVGALKR